ncbi:MAG: hypothetical protein LBD91_05060 [Prevotellaceae bacterium]|jgi:C-terminal processing protease CtpA/Prc|nr:hypothetical protein [Prevotellaceae bacterium]
MKNLKLLLFSIFYVCLSAVQAQPIRPVMHSNQRNIKLIINGGENDWTITSSLNPDVLSLYSSTKKTYDIKFISDIDSLVFTVKVNEPVYFDVIYKGDTAHTAIDFTNRFASKLSENDKLYALSLFWSEAKYNFAFIDKLKFDLDSLYKTFIPKVQATANDYEFYEVMKLFAGNFHDGHTQVHYSEDSYTDYVPMSARYFDDELRIIHVKESAAATFPIGSTIIEVNGLKTEDYMRKYVTPYINSDYEPTVRRLAASALLSAKLSTDTLTIKYQTPDNKLLTNPLVRDGRNREGEPSVGYQLSYWQKPVEITWQAHDIAVLAFNTFNDKNGELIAQFEKLKDTLYYAKGIIIDLRQNGGGSTNVAWHLLQYIIKNADFLNFAWQTRTNDGVRKAQGNFRKEYEDYYKNAAYRTVPADTVFIPDSIKRFNVPVAVLFSTMTVSAAEDFLIILYERPDRPLFIGQPSFGSTGSPLVVWGFPNNGFARVCARRVLFPYSMKPFTEGIQPDILVNYSFDEFILGKDKDIEIAV